MKERQRDREPVHHHAVVEQAFQQGLSFAHQVPCRFGGGVSNHPVEALLNPRVHAGPREEQHGLVCSRWVGIGPDPTPGHAFVVVHFRQRADANETSGVLVHLVLESVERRLQLGRTEHSKGLVHETGGQQSDITLGLRQDVEMLVVGCQPFQHR